MNNLVVQFIKKKIDHYIEKHIEKVLEKHFKYHYYNELWEALQRDGNEKTIKLLDSGVKIYCHFDSIIEKMIFQEAFENSEIQFVNNFFRRGDLFVDIGANSGLFTVIAGKKVENRGRVIAFEPTKRIMNRLKENIKLNNLSNVTTLPVAVSTKNEKLDFFLLNDGYDAWNSVVKPFVDAKCTRVQVDAIQIDRLKEEQINLLDAAMVKIDIEGWELNALKGGEKILRDKSAPTLMVEFAQEHALNAGSSVSALYEYIEYLGYGLYRYDEQANSLSKASNEEYYYTNLIATKDYEFVAGRLEGKDGG